MNKKIYSPEPLDDLMDKTIADNGEYFTSISINRNNKATDIYVTFSNTKKVIPKIYRGYRENGVMIYNHRIFDIQEISETRTVNFSYDWLNDKNYISYYVVFESLNSDCELIVDQIGVVFDIFDMTSDNVKKFSTSLVTDINNNPLYEQDYTYTNSFSIIMNRTDLEQLCNIIEKPYYLVDILNDNIDNSSDLLVATSISPTFLTSATKVMSVNIDNLVTI